MCFSTSTDGFLGSASSRMHARDVPSTDGKRCNLRGLTRDDWSEAVIATVGATPEEEGLGSAAGGQPGQRTGRAR